jgi:AraC family transcriptional regulator
MGRGQFDPVTLGAPRFQTLETGAFIVTDACFPSRLALPPHVHERAVVGVTLDGQFDSVMMGRTYDCRPGIVHTEPAGERHANFFQPGGSRVLIIQPDAECEELLRPVKPLLESIRSFSCGPAVGVGHRLVAELARHDAWTALAVEGLALEVLAIAARTGLRPRAACPPPWLARVRDRVHDEGGSRLRVGDLAADAGVHPVHLARVFRAHYGTSIGRCLRARHSPRECAARPAPHRSPARGHRCRRGLHRSKPLHAAVPADLRIHAGRLPPYVPARHVLIVAPAAVAAH